MNQYNLQKKGRQERSQKKHEIMMSAKKSSQIIQKPRLARFLRFDSFMHFGKIDFLYVYSLGTKEC